jgi:hypothetical protein
MHTDGSVDERPRGRQNGQSSSWRRVRFEIHDPAGLVADFSERTVRQREREFMIALLEDAFNCYRKYAFSGTRRGRRLFEEAEAWLMEPDTEAAITFEYVCEVLGIEPDPIRHGLARWRGEAAVGQTDDVELCSGDLSHVRSNGTSPSTKAIPLATPGVLEPTPHEEVTR